MPPPADAPDTTEGGRWIVVDGRRWRATDPSIPEAFRKELVGELMSARRAVHAAQRVDDDEAVAAARRRVDDSKHALGERGRAWWEEPDGTATRVRLRATILALARHRSPKTICPSDAARAVGGDHWRSLMDDARAVGGALRDAGEIEITQRGEPVDAREHPRGPVRFRLRKDDDRDD